MRPGRILRLGLPQEQLNTPARYDLTITHRAGAKPLLADELWKLIEPCLPPPRRRAKGGRKPIDHRRTLTGILFVLKTGIPWEDLPQEMGCGCGMTCRRRLHEWQEAGVWQDIHHEWLNRLREADKIDWSRAVVDSASVRAVFGGR